MDLITYNSINEYFATNNKGILTQVEKDYLEIINTEIKNLDLK